MLRFKEGSISSVYGEYQVLRKLSPSRQEEIYLEPGKGDKEKKVWHNYVAGIAYEGHHLKFIENGENVEEKVLFPDGSAGNEKDSKRTGGVRKEEMEDRKLGV